MPAATRRGRDRSKFGDTGIFGSAARLTARFRPQSNGAALVGQARIAIDDRLGIEQRLLEGVGSGEIRQRRALAHRNAQPDDGLLEVGVTNAEGLGQWARTVARTVVGSTAKSPFVQVTKAKKIHP